MEQTPILPGQGATSATLTLTAVLVSLTLPASCLGEINVAAFLGLARPHAGEVHLVESNGTDVRISPVAWDDASFSFPLYYNLRLAYWSSRLEGWGIGLDFTHAKLYADSGDSVQVSGDRAGAPVDVDEPLSATFRSLRFSHGCNFLTVDFLRRWIGEFSLPASARFGLHVGLGGGIAIPHVEVTTAATNISGYRIAGPTAHGLAGLTFYFAEWIGLTAQYKFSWNLIRADDGKGTEVSTNVFMHHITAGLTGFISWDRDQAN